MANILPGDDISSDLFPQLRSFGKVGAFGEVLFEVSDYRVRTFDDYKMNSKGRYAKHEIIGREPALEFLGRDLREVQFKMTFNRRLGVNPKKEVARLRQMCEKGVAEYLVIGLEVMGVFVLESLSEELRAVDKFGTVLLAEVSVKLKEYGAQKWSTI